MKNLSHGLALLAITTWVGGLWSIGYLAVPVLFQTLPDRMLAGMLAGKMFTLISYTGIICSVYLLAYHVKRAGRASLRQTQFWVILAMLLLTLAVQFGIQPMMADLKAQALPAEVMQSPYATRFKTLHGISSIMYLAQSLLGALLVLKFRGTPYSN